RVLYPFGAGDHVDHLQVKAGVEAIRVHYPQCQFVPFYDQPYTHRHIDRYADELQRAYAYHPNATAMDAKLTACLAYRTQVGFQFGNEEAMKRFLGTTEYFTQPPRG
ncbi:MAG: hypothetical protein WA952_19595, partial [Lewinella sp.]